VIDEKTARLVLFSAITPGNIFWGNQVASLGASQVYQKIIKESSYSRISDYQEVKEKVATSKPLDLSLSGLSKNYQGKQLLKDFRLSRGKREGSNLKTLRFDR